MDSALRINKTYTKFYASHPGNYKVLLRGRKARYRDLTFYITAGDEIVEATTGRKVPIKLEQIESYYDLIKSKITEFESVDKLPENNNTSF